MKIVNNSGLPELVFTFLKNDFYDFVPNENSISATGLEKPIRETILTQRHTSEIEVDAITRVWSLFGSGVHAVLEQGNLSDQQEERITVDFHGFRVSGKFDIVKNDTLYDFKTTFSWTLVYGSRDEDWKFQLSIYRWLYFKKYGRLLNPKGKIIAIIKDWRKSMLDKTPGYPQLPIVELTYDLYSIDDTGSMISQRIDKLNSAKKLPDNNLPECTDQERWNGKKCKDYCLAYRFCNCRTELQEKPIRKQRKNKN